MLSRGSGALEYTYGGAARVAQFQRSQRKEWTVALAVPESKSLAGARKIQTSVILLGLLVLAATFAAAWIVTGRTAHAIVHMTAELGSGTAQFTSAASQIAANSESLAQGTTEQVASLEEAAASAEQVASVTADNKKRTNALASTMQQARAVSRS